MSAMQPYLFNLAPPEAFAGFPDAALYIDVFNYLWPQLVKDAKDTSASNHLWSKALVDEIRRRPWSDAAWRLAGLDEDGQPLELAAMMADLLLGRPQDVVCQAQLPFATAVLATTSEEDRAVAFKLLTDGVDTVAAAQLVLELSDDVFIHDNWSHVVGFLDACIHWGQPQLPPAIVSRLNTALLRPQDMATLALAKIVPEKLEASRKLASIWSYRPFAGEDAIHNHIQDMARQLSVEDWVRFAALLESEHAAIPSTLYMLPAAIENTLQLITSC